MRYEPDLDALEEMFSPLDWIFHITHVSDALSILESGFLKAIPARELNGYRAVWLSPEVYPDKKSTYVLPLLGQPRRTAISPSPWLGSYTPGSFFGSVRFVFSWPRFFSGLVGKKNCYLVSHEEKPVVHAHAGDPDPFSYCLQLLVTDDVCDLQPYEPRTWGGDWWHDEINDRHFLATRCRLVLIFGSDVSIQYANSMDFVLHDAQDCVKAKENSIPCPDRGLSRYATSRMLFSRLVCRDINAHVPALLMTDGRNGHSRLSMPMAMAAFDVLRTCTETTGTFNGSIGGMDSRALSLVKTALAAYGDGDGVQFQHAIAGFSDARNAVLSFGTAIARTFRVSLTSIIPFAFVYREFPKWLESHKNIAHILEQFSPKHA